MAEVWAVNKMANERVIQLEIPEREMFCICNMEMEGGGYFQCKECVEFFHKECVLCKSQEASELMGFVCPWCWKGSLENEQKGRTQVYNQGKHIKAEETARGKKELNMRFQRMNGGI